MIGFLDAGGGMKGIFTSGIYDFLMDNAVEPDYCIGVSAGSANLITYIAGQKGRTCRFYLDYAFEKDYMSLHNFYKKGYFIDLNYIYSVLSNEDGKDPLSYDAICASKSRFVAVATDADSGQPFYLDKSELHRNDYTVLKASCAMPIIGKPVELNGKKMFDGGISDPLPYKKAFADGCDKLVVCLTNPIAYEKKALPKSAERLLHTYPAAARAVMTMHEKYNTCLQELRTLERQGKVLLLAPQDGNTVKTLTRNAKKLEKMYTDGYHAAQAVLDFIEK